MCVSVTTYTLKLHTRASDELDTIPTTARDRLTDTLVDVAATRSPSTHESVKHMDGPVDLMRVRVGEYRAVIALEKPNLLVLRVGHRGTVYREKSELGSRLDA